MNLTKKLFDPKKEKILKEFTGTNQVFLIEYNQTKAVYKKFTTFSSLANIYYTFCDQFFYKNRRLSTKKTRCLREILCLNELNGQDAPKLINHNKTSLIREYLEGYNFRDYTKTDTDKVIKLEDAFDSLQRIHSKNIFIGDAHVKNIFFKNNNQTYWLDFDGKFTEDLVTNKAIDVLKFVYSTYTETKSHDITCINAQNVRLQLKNHDTKEKVKKLLNKKPSSLKLWLPTRIAKPTNKEIQKILTS